MPKSLRRREQRLLGEGFFLLLLIWAVSLAWGASDAEAQALPLKRDLPGRGGFSCPETVQGRDPTPEEQAQARVMGSNADQSLILGDQARARDLFARATELDPSSPELAYRYARILEDLDQRPEAITEYCRALALGAEEVGIEDARSRLDALVVADQPQVSEEAILAFEAGLNQADAGFLQPAADAFDTAFRQAPNWAAAVYNRGVVRDRQGDVEGAAADYRDYLSLRPEGEDAIAVSQRIGELQALVPLPSAGTTLTLGLLIPGMGQFYSGRALGGFTVLGLAGGAIAAGLLIKEIETLCVGSVQSGADCPPERVIGENTNKPYLTHSLLAAGVVSLIGAVEAFLNVRGDGPGGDGELLSVDVGNARIGVPSLTATGPRLKVSLIKVTF
jgi:tetratricopeptide (TPR) repeat protein